MRKRRPISEQLQPPAGRVRLHHVDDSPRPPDRVLVDPVHWVTVTRPRGRGTGDRVSEHFPLVGWVPRTGWHHNQPLYEWAAIVGKLLVSGDREYKIGGMYVEFENVADPGDAVSPPSFSRASTEGVEYYDGLVHTTDRDYMRVPLTAAVLDTSDATLYPKGNMPIFFAQTSGLYGVHHKPFSDADNSKVFGGALVAFADDDDPTQDLVLSRFYLPTAEQQVKLSSSQIGMEWELQLK